MKNKNNVRKQRKHFHYIYKIHFLCGYPSGRYYLGKRTYYGPSIDDDKYTGSGTFCFAYFKKYGKIAGETYIKEILEINPSVEVNAEREKYWIGTKYKDDELCMNIISGGKGNSDHEVSCYLQDQYKKDINQYELDGTYIKTWHGVREAARELGIAKTGIQSVLSGKKPSAYNYIWKYYDGNTNNIQPHFSINPIIQYTKDGEYMTEYKNSSDANKHTNIDNGTILATCRGERISAGGYIWRFKGDPFDKYRTEKLNTTSKKGKYTDREIQQLDMQGNLIKLWKSVREVVDTLHIVESSIYCAAKGTRKSAGGYKWIFTDQIKKEV